MNSRLGEIHNIWYNKLKIQRHLSIVTGEVNQLEQCLVRDAVTGLVQGDDVEVIKAWILVQVWGSHPGRPSYSLCNHEELI